MDELIREINGVREEIEHHDFRPGTPNLDMEFMSRQVAQLCNLMVAVLRSAQTVPDHQHFLNSFESGRTRAVIPHGY